MKNITLKTASSQFYNESLLKDFLPAIDLAVLIEKMKNSRSWLKGDVNAMILFRSSEKQIVLTALHEETEIKSFQSNDSITFQIIEGELMFHSREESVKIEKGQVFSLYEKINYSLTTKEQTVFLTITNGAILPAGN